MPTREDALDLLRNYAEQQDLPCEPGSRPGELVISLPGEKKLKTVCLLTVGERDVAATAFVIRHPDEGHDEVHRYLLQRNLRLRGVAYAIDPSGDVYVVGRLPLAAIDVDAVDALLGSVLAAADEPFNELLILGFLSSMRREWAWRVSRGESLRNLEAFKEILDPEAPSQPDATPTASPTATPTGPITAPTTQGAGGALGLRP